MADVRALVIQDGIVVNAVLASEAFATSQGWRFGAGTEAVDIGWAYRNGAFWPPEAPPAPVASLGPISDRQFFQALAMQPFAIITPQEALDAVKTGEIPPVMQTVIDDMDPGAQFAATMILAGGTSYEREHPLVAAFGAHQGMDAAQIDAFWRFAQEL